MKNGVVQPQFRGDQSQQPNARSGTALNSRKVNDDGPPRRSGTVVLSENGINMNSPESNGNGVVLDGITRESDYSPRGAATLDSPVPAGSPHFPAGAMRAENIAHLGTGKGANASQAGDVLTAIGGVMSRDMVGTTTPGGSETALTKDDYV